MIYDLIVIGGGPAGYLASERAGHADLKTLLIEKENVGGVCLNEGCVPSKTLLHSAKIYDYITTSSKYGVTCEKVLFDQEYVIRRKNKVVKKLVGGIKATLKKCGVTLIKGEGKIVGKSTEGFEIESNNEMYIGKNILIATGSKTTIPPIPGLMEGLQSGSVVTNKEVLDFKEIPDRLVIIGGGVIGLEMASYYNSVGSKVTVVEMLDHIGGPTDREISSILLDNYMTKGVNFELNAKVIEINSDVVIFEKDGKSLEVKGDKILLSIGRKPNTQGIGLETLGIATKKGAIIVDETCQTNLSNVYAAGDVNGKSMLAHTAYREAEVVVNNILGKKDIMRYLAIPSVIYTNPEVASVGETEETAKRKGIDFTIKKLPMNFSGRYMAENEKGNGIAKVIIDNKFNKVVGVQLIGSYASEIIYGAGIMVETEMLVNDIKELVFPHPTVSEIIREVIFS